MRLLRERSRELRLILFIGLCVLALVFFAKRFDPNVGQRDVDQTRRDKIGEGLPAQGLAQNPVGYKVPGDPNNGIKDLKKLGEFVNIYKSRHGGKYPLNMLELNQDYIQHYSQYGIKSSFDAVTMFRNPDSKYADSKTMRHDPKGTIPYVIQGTRLDGTPVGGAKKPGERDVLGVTNIYYHENIVNRNLPAKDSADPVGFFLVLYDDGAVDKVPWQNVRLVKSSGGNQSPTMYSYGFPGQPGVSDDAPLLKTRFGDMPGI